LRLCSFLCLQTVVYERRSPPPDSADIHLELSSFAPFLIPSGLEKVIKLAHHVWKEYRGCSGLPGHPLFLTMVTAIVGDH
jgi:hypothetical protein